MAFKSFSSPSATANQRTHAKTGGYGYANKKTRAHDECATSRRPAPRPHQPLHNASQTLQRITALLELSRIQTLELELELQDQQIQHLKLQIQLLELQALPQRAPNKKDQPEYSAHQRQRLD